MVRNEAPARAKAAGERQLPNDLSLPRQSSTLRVPWKGAPDPRERYPAGKLSLQPEALGADQEATNGLKHSEKRP